MTPIDFPETEFFPEENENWHSDLGTKPPAELVEFVDKAAESIGNRAGHYRAAAKTSPRTQVLRKSFGWGLVILSLVLFFSGAFGASNEPAATYYLLTGMLLGALVVNWLLTLWYWLLLYGVLLSAELPPVLQGWQTLGAICIAACIVSRLVFFLIDVANGYINGFWYGLWMFARYIVIPAFSHSADDD